MRRLVGFWAIAALAGCNWMEHSDPAPRTDLAEAQLKQVRRACASQLTYARLKEYVFDEAAQIRRSDPRRFDSLAAYSVVRMDDPVVKSRDEQLNIVVCRGRFVLNLPPGIQDSFNGQPVIAAEVEYAAQAAADGSGLVYSMNGAEPIIYRLATLGLSGPPLPQVAAAPAVAPTAPDTPAIRPVETVPKPPPPTPQARPRPNPVIARAAEPKAAARPPEITRVARTSAPPSFHCRRARAASERMVCGNGSLAAADRRMSAVFYDELARADAPTKTALRRTRDQFLRTRERCSSEACVARVYAQRVAEIRRIARR